jgi:lysophospholipase L1-like esterase
MFTIVCLGDSITCEWDEPKYPTFWQELLDQKYSPGKVKVISAGINGETAQDGYYRLDSRRLIHKPDLVTIMFGHNDLYWQIPPESYNNYLRKIYNYLNHAGVQNIWLVSPNQVGDQEFARTIPTIFPSRQRRGT